MADLQIGIDKETGQRFVKLPGGATQEINQAQYDQINSDPGMISNIMGAAGDATGSLVGGAMELLGIDADYAKQARTKANESLIARGLGSPISTLAGQSLPYMAGEALAVPAGPAGMAAMGGMMGAASDPENPIQGAAIGAVTGALPGVLGAAGRGAKNMTGRVLDKIDLGDPLLNKNMTGRVLNNIDNATPKPTQGQFYKGLMGSGELDAAGVPMTQGMRTALDATDTATAQYAKKQIWKEGLQGVGEQEKRAQRGYLTNLVKTEMGVTDDVALTDGVLNDVLKKEGQQIGSILKSRGNLNIGAGSIDDMKSVINTAETGWKGPLNSVVKDIEQNIKVNGALTPDSYQNAITKLNDIGAPGRSAGAIQDAKKIRDLLSKQVEDKLSQAEKQLLAESRYRYKIAKTARQGRGVGSDMMINPQTFGANWDKKIAQTARGKDVIGKAADTMNFLSTMEANAGTTLQRNIATLPAKIKGAAPAVIGASLGVPAVGTAYNTLLGD